MQIQTQCQCGAKFAFTNEQVGQAFRCSVCHQVFNVPPPGQKPVMDPVQAPLKASPPPPPQYIPAPPPPQYRQSGPSGIGSCILTFLIIFGIIGGLAMLGTFVAYRTSAAIGESFQNIEGMVQMAKSAQELANPEEIIKSYKDKGYEHIVAQTTSEPETIEDDRLYTCQILDLKADSQANLAILSQSATLRGEIKGDVDFLGQMLTIDKDAVIHGNLNLRFAQMVNIKGAVKGAMTGGYQILTGKDNIEGGIEAEGALADLIMESVRDARDEVKIEIDDKGVHVQVDED